jgi:hypothetical protein
MGEGNHPNHVLFISVDKSVRKTAQNGEPMPVVIGGLKFGKLLDHRESAFQFLAQTDGGISAACEIPRQSSLNLCFRFGVKGDFSHLGRPLYECVDALRSRELAAQFPNRFPRIAAGSRPARIHRKAGPALALRQSRPRSARTALPQARQARSARPVRSLSAWLDSPSRRCGYSVLTFSVSFLLPRRTPKSSVSPFL